MDQRTIEAAIRFFISRLSESDLREFDEVMKGSSLDVPQGLDRNVVPAMDAAPGSRERQAYLAMGPTARKAIRHGRLAHHGGMATDSAEKLEYAQRFPHADRLAG